MVLHRILSYTAQEFPFTFTDCVEAVSLKSGSVSGVFKITENGKIIFGWKENGGFPEVKELKQLIFSLKVGGKKLRNL